MLTLRHEAARMEATVGDKSPKSKLRAQKQKAAKQEQFTHERRQQDTQPVSPEKDENRSNS